MPTGKSPGNDVLNKEFYEQFWDDLKFYFLNSLKQSKINGHLSISQRQAIIKLIAKKYRDKSLSKTCDQFRYLMLTEKYFLNHWRKTEAYSP